MTDVSAMVSQYIATRDAAAKLKSDFEAKYNQLKSHMEDIELEIMTLANNLGVDNFKTSFGTAYRNVKQSYNVENWEEFSKWVVENDPHLQTVQKRVVKAAVDELCEEFGIEIPPGISVHTEVKFNIRK